MSFENLKQKQKRNQTVGKISMRRARGRESIIGRDREAGLLVLEGVREKGKGMEREMIKKICSCEQ
jgi:hypothetical protein